MSTPPPIQQSARKQPPRVVYVQQPKPKTRRLTWLLGFFALLVLVTMVTSESSKTGKEAETPNTAYQRCEHVIRQSLNDPESAIFSDEFYERRKDGNFEVGGVVRARNGFGGMVRQNWTMIISPDLDCLYSKVGKTESGVYPSVRQ